MPSLRQDFTLEQGTGLTVTWTVTDAGGAPVDHTGKSFRFRASRNGADALIDALIERDSGFTVSGGSGEDVGLPLVAADTEGLVLCAGFELLHYDIRNTTDEIVLASGRLKLVASPSRDS